MPGAGGSGGGGAGGAGSNGANGTTNSGGGGGGGGGTGTPYNGGNGGSGMVIIRAPSAVTMSVSPGTNATAAHPGGDKIATFTVSGTLTVT